MESKEILKNVHHFTQLPTIIDLQEESHRYGNLLNEIGQHQPFSSTELLPKNKGKFGLLLEKETQLIEKLYLNADILAMQSGFTKEVLDSLPRNNELNGARSLARQFFAMIRNKQKLLKKEQTLLERRDEMWGLKNHIERMNELISKL